jgi:signal recognition particle receptor subunit beta
VLIPQAELFNLLDHEHLAGAAILVMANKQDLKDAMTVKEMTNVLALHTIKRHDWQIQVCFLGSVVSRLYFPLQYVYS